MTKSQKLILSTNHHNKTAMIQIMLKLNCLETLTDENYQRTTRMHTYSKCKEVGHNSKTCPTHNLWNNVTVTILYLAHAPMIVIIDSN